MFSESLRLLVIEGYVRADRERLVESGMSAASDLYTDVLKSLAPNATVDIVTPADPDTPLPSGEQLAAYDGVAMTGSSLSVIDSEHESVRPQIDLIDEVFEQGVPSTGSCWAMQVGVVAAGGVVGQNPKGREMGVARKVALTDAGRAHPLYDGKPAVFDALASHEDEITVPPPNSTILSGNSMSDIQSIEIRHRNGVMWTVQYHPEYNLRELAALIRCREERLIRMGFFDSSESLTDYADKLEAVHEDNNRKDLTWALGIDSDILDPNIRYRELSNWIKFQVLPRACSA